MKHVFTTATLLFFAALTPLSSAAPTVFPTGTTLYDPSQTWNGYTVLSVLDTQAVIVIDMNGKVVKRWDGFNVSAGGPARVLPGGNVMAPQGARPGHQESLSLVEQDFNGKELWSFNRSEQITNPQQAQVWSARQHHDWQRADFPAGYYSPAFTPAATGSNTLLLTHAAVQKPAIADVLLEDDRLIEVDASGNIVWEWNASDHVDEFQFNADERAAIKANAATGSGGPGSGRAAFDWMHINSADYVGPNALFDAGDQRFAPNNVIISSRQSSVIAIINRAGNVVWQLGPDFSRNPQQWALGQIIGQHHAHMIPQGLPGAGNIMIFDNGGSSGYGKPSAQSQNGMGLYARATSRVLEINPVTLEKVWSYAAANFFSTNISGAQRLANGNTLITEGAPGRVFEVTKAGKIVWEYMNAPGEGPRGSNSVYRAYRIPYEWLPQVSKPTERAVTPPPAGQFVVPAAQ